MSISLRLSEKENELIKSFAQLHGVSVSEFIRRSVMERIEDEYDIKCYEEAKAELEQNPETVSHEDLKKKYGL